MMIGSDGREACSLVSNSRHFPRRRLRQLPIHQEQVSGESLSGTGSNPRLGVQVHGEAVLENSVKVIQDCGIRVKRHDVRFALALRLQIRPDGMLTIPVSFLCFQTAYGRGLSRLTKIVERSVL